jgi:HJR/Mrr/RecB family endonuclease
MRDASHLNLRLQLLTLAMADVPPRTAHIFTLSRARRWSPDRIARRIGLSPQAVKRHLVKGLISVSRSLSRVKQEGDLSADELYDVSKQVVDPASKVIARVAPKIVVASAALADRLKREPQSVYDLAPRQFELLIAELLEDLGYRVELTRATRDGGKDLLAYLETDVGTLLCLIEAKKYRRDHKVGVELVRALYGTLTDAQANHAMLITTSSFTKDAHEFQRRHQYQLALRDYNDLERWIRQYGGRGTREARQGRKTGGE